MSISSTASTVNKVLAIGLAITLVAWTFSAFFALPAQAVDAHPNGSLVLSGSTIFRVMDGSRQGFPSANVFLSQGYEWDNVVPANSADLALAQGSNLMLRDGTLVNDGGTVYIVTNGQKRGFTSAAVFTGLGYNFANVITDNLSSYAQAADINETSGAHPAGTLVNSNGTIWLVTSTGRMGIPSLAVFQSHGFNFANVVPANSGDTSLATEANLSLRVGSLVNDGGTIWAVTSSTEKRGFPTASCFLDFGFSFANVINGTTSGLTAGSNLCDGSTPPTPPTDPETPSTGTLSVSLASDTPAAGIAIKNAARVPFTKVNLTASGGDVVIDSWMVERTGIANDSSLASIDIIDNATNATINNTAKTLSSTHTANFTEDFTIKNGTTKSVMLAANIASAPGAGEQPKLALKSLTLKGSANLSGSLPIVGNAQTLNDTITIGTATVQRGVYSNATSSTLEVGKTGYTFMSFRIEAGSQEDISFSQVKVYNQGSASLVNDLKNIKLYRDGTFLADGVIDGNYVNFSFPAQAIAKGQTAQYQVKADIESGSARTIDLGIWRTTDIYVKGNTYNTGITPTYSGTGSSANSPVLSDNTFTISTGTLRVGRSNTVGAENISIGNDQVLGAFEFEAKGENVEVTALTLTIASSTGSQTEDALQSVKIVDANGAIVAGPTDVTNNALTVAFSDSFTAPVGTNHYKVVGNLANNGGWASNDTITVSIATPASAITATGETTGQSISATPGSTIEASTQTVKASSLTVTENSTPTDKTVITNSTDVLIASWTFDATDSGEDIRVTAITVKASTTGKLNALTLKLDGTPINPVVDNPGNSSDIDATFALTEPFTVTKGASRDVSLYANIGSNALAGEVDAWELDHTNADSVVATGVDTGNNASESITNNGDGGPLITIAAAGTLTVNLDASSPATRQVVHGSTGVELSNVNLKATNEAVNVTQVKVRVADGALTGTNAGTFSQIAKAYLKLNGAIIGNASGYNLGQASTQINLSQGVLQVPANDSGVILSVVGDIVSLATNQPGVANADIKVGLNGANGFVARGVGSNGTVTPTYNDSTGSPVILHKSRPVVVLSSPGTLTGGSTEVVQAAISAVGDDVGIHRLSFQTTTTTGLSLSNAFLRLKSCTGTCGGIAAGTVLSTTQTAGTGFGNGVQTWSFTITSNSGTHGKQYLAISPGSTANVVLAMTVTGVDSGDAVSTSLLGDTATTTDEVAGDAAAEFAHLNQGNFVWSDLNLNESQAAAALTSGQWYNGYYVEGLGPNTTSTPVAVSQ